MLALALRRMGQQVFLLDEADLAWGNRPTPLRVRGIDGSFEDGGHYMKNVTAVGESYETPGKGDIVHMRLDPPFDTRYLRALWLLEEWEGQGVRVINRPRSIMRWNEKLVAYRRPEAVASWVGREVGGFTAFLKQLEAEGVAEVVLKPLDLYSGIGVEKWRLNDPGLFARFAAKTSELGGALVAQAFMPEVAKGEIRALYFAGEHLGSILKKPKAGDFISNIAHGGTFEACELPSQARQRCEEMCAEFSQDGVPWVAFDILGDVVTEANITCPGLLVEVSHAHKKDLAARIGELI